MGGVFVVALAFLVIAILVDKLFKPLSNMVLRVYDEYISPRLAEYFVRK